ncbi:MAG: trypsin-like serine protease [Ruminococcus sp.]|nr:trypsin-like serine protease [Ruminococcus sp.]
MRIRFGSKNSESAGKSGFGVSSVIGAAAIIFMAAGFFYLYSERETIPADEDVKSAFVLSQVSRELTVPEIVKKAKPSVVGISSRFGESTVGTGTGIIMSEDGYIVTNAHVVKNSSDKAESVTVVLSDKSEYPAEIVGADSRTDLAVIKIDTGAAKLSAAEFGDSSALSEGELAVAIGNPLGFELYGSVTSGIISALDRTITVDEYTMTLIQTDAAINPGNSGGPLLNSCGQVIGINSSKIISDSAEGLGFAIPITSAKPIIDELMKNGFISGRPRIGISGEDVTEDIAIYYDLPQGVYVRFVENNSAADTAGIRSGDIIVSADGKPIKTMQELNAVKDKFKSGEELVVTVYRAKSRIEIKIILGAEEN